VGIESDESLSAVDDSAELTTSLWSFVDIGLRVASRCADESFTASGRSTAGSTASESTSVPGLIDPPGARTFTDGREFRGAAPATDAFEPDADGDDELPVGGAEAPASESSAAAIPELAAIANPSPNAKAADPTRTPNATAFMTPPTVANPLG